MGCKFHETREKCWHFDHREKSSAVSTSPAEGEQTYCGLHSLKVYLTRSSNSETGECFYFRPNLTAIRQSLLPWHWFSRPNWGPPSEYGHFRLSATTELRAQSVLVAETSTVTTSYMSKSLCLRVIIFVTLHDYYVDRKCMNYFTIVTRPNRRHWSPLRVHKTFPRSG